MKDLNFMSSGCHMLDYHRLVHDAHPGTVPTFVVTLPGSQQFFCSTIGVAGKILEDLENGKVVNVPKNVPYGNDWWMNIPKEEVALCTVTPFYPASYITEPGWLEMILQSGDEAMFLMREYPSMTKWAVYWNWSNVFPEHEYFFYP